MTIENMIDFPYDDYQQLYRAFIEKSVKISDISNDLELFCYSDIIYLLVGDRQVLGNLNVSPITIGSQTYLNITGMFVDPNHWASSIIYWLIYSVKETAKYPVIADHTIFDRRQYLLSCLRKHKYFDIGILDQLTGEVSEFNNLSISRPNLAYIFRPTVLGFDLDMFQRSNSPYVWNPFTEDMSQ